jgi:hypothetical protein
LSKKQYSTSQFGRDAEFIIALYLISKGWQVKLSKGSRGPADLMAKKDLILLYIQIKASSKLPRIKGSNITKLKSKSNLEGALPVIATLQPFLQLSNHNKETMTITTTTTSTAAKPAIKKSINKNEEKKIEFKIYFYNLYDWSRLEL